MGDSCALLLGVLTGLVPQAQDLIGDDKFDPSRAREKLVAYLRAEPVGLDFISVRRLVFSVPGTVDW